MNNIVLSFGIIILLIIVGSLLGNFFDLKAEYYLPFILWGIALCIFNLILTKQKKNIYLENIK